MAHKKYTFESWVPQYYHPEPPKDWPPSTGTANNKKTIEFGAKDNKAAIKKITTDLQTSRILIGNLRNAKGILVAKCYTIVTISKGTWDDPPQFCHEKVQVFLAKNDTEAKKEYQKAPQHEGDWGSKKLYGTE